MTTSENARDYEGLFWNDGATLVVREDPDEKRVYDLEERTASFGEAIIDFAKTIPQNAVTYRIIGQLIGAATSVGAIRASSLFRHSSFVIRHFPHA